VKPERDFQKREDRLSKGSPTREISTSSHRTWGGGGGVNVRGKGFSQGKNENKKKKNVKGP